MKQRAEDIQSLSLEFSDEKWAVWVGCKRAEHWRLLLVGAILPAYVVHLLVQEHRGPLRTAWQQKSLSACKRPHNMHDTTT